MPPIDLEELQRSMDRLKQANDRFHQENELLQQLEELREVNEQKFLLGLSGDGSEKPGCEVGSSRDESEATLGRLDEVMDETQAPSGEREQEKETVKEDNMDEDKEQRDTGEDSSDEAVEEEEAQFTEYGSNSGSDDNKAMTDEWNSDDPEHQLDDNMESDSEYDAEEEQRALHEKLKEYPPRLRRNQFLSRYKLAKFGATTVADEEFLNAGVSFTTKVGDCKLDASLYVPTQLDPIVRRDYAVYKSVYGLHPGIVSLIGEPALITLYMDMRIQLTTQTTNPQSSS